MPAAYAHSRFGTRMLKHMPPKVLEATGTYRRLYQIGTLGPDLLFYHNPLMTGNVVRLGEKIHLQPGKVFLARACRQLRLRPELPAFAYLYGLLTHFCLDSICHPYVNALAFDGPVSHSAIEADFDRSLMELDGISTPHNRVLAEDIRPTMEDSRLISRFYGDITPGQIRLCAKHMRLLGRAFAAPKSHHTRKKLKSILRCTAGEMAEGLVMEDCPDPRCQESTRQLHALFREAETRFPQMLENLLGHLKKNDPLGPDFDRIFG